MTQRDLHHSIKASNALDTAAITSDTTTVGEIIDTQGFESTEFLIQSGVITDGSYAVLVEEGDDSGLSDAAAVADDDLLGTELLAAFVAADDNKVAKIGYLGSKRFVRVSLVSTGTTTGGTFGAIAVQSHARHDVSEDAQLV